MVEAASESTSQQSGRRDAIKQELLTRAKNYFDTFQSHSVVLEVPERKYVARQTFDEAGNCVTIIRFRCDGFTEEHWNRWKADPIAVQIKMNHDRLDAFRLDDDEGCRVYHLKMKMPMMISNRSIITCFYEHYDAETDQRIVVHSSQGNEAVIADRQREIGKDVIANSIVTYMAGTPYEGGFELNQIISMDIAGMIPGFVKTKIAKRLANVGLQIADYMMHGTIPPKPF